LFCFVCAVCLQAALEELLVGEFDEDTLAGRILLIPGLKAGTRGRYIAGRARVLLDEDESYTIQGKAYEAIKTLANSEVVFPSAKELKGMKLRPPQVIHSLIMIHDCSS